MFILLSSEKNEPRSAAAVIGLCRSAAGTALGGCGTRCAQTLLALILGWLASSRPDKGGGTLYASFWSFRATTRYPEISGLAFYPVSFSAYTFYRAAGPRIGVRGDGFVSYRAATWRLSHSAQRRGIQRTPGGNGREMFILLSSEKNEPRSAAAVIGLCRSAAGAALPAR